MNLPHGKVQERLKKAVSNLFKKNPHLFHFTDATGQTEWNLAHHLANEIHKVFPSFDKDLDVAKPDFDHKRPDIIFHKRETHDFNFLVIELKYNAKKEKITQEIKKIKDNWFQQPLSYKYGAVINLLENGKNEIVLIKNN